MTVPLRAALYLRVSTARQAEHDVSIPDQKRQGEAYCVSRGYQLVETYVESGASATNDRRSRTVLTASRPSVIRRRLMPSVPRPCLRTPAARPLARRWCAPWPKPRGGISASKGVAIAVTIFARSPSALRSLMARSGSWDRSRGCYRC